MPTAATPAPRGAPPVGDVFLDVRTTDRALRVTHHPAGPGGGPPGVVVFSLWRGDRCVGSFRLSVDDALRLAATLIEVAVAEQPDEPPDPSPAT